MEEEETAEGLAIEHEERRAYPRHVMEESTAIVILEQGASFRCRVLDLSLEGCRLHTSPRFPGSAWDRVDVSFKLRGISLRFSGVIQWIDGRQKIGIRFADLTTRRNEELAEVLAEVNALNAAKQGIGNRKKP
jgi:hypothetical protein